MRLEFRQTESLLLNRILDLENDSDFQKDSVGKGNEYLLLKEKVVLLENRLDNMDRLISSSTNLSSQDTNGANSTDTSDLYKSLDNISKEVNELRS